MSALLMSSMPAPARCAHTRSSVGASSSAPSCFLRPARFTVRRGAVPASFGCDPRFNGRSGFWGGPNVVGGMNSPNMADVLNKPLAEVLQQLERDFGRAAQQQRQRQGQDGTTATQASGMGLPFDSIESQDAISYFIDLPGLEKADVSIQANQQKRTITVSGERLQPSIGEEESQQTRNVQRRFGKFSQTIQLPKEADSQLISAKVDKGVLRIKVLKSSEAEPDVQTVRID